MDDCLIVQLASRSSQLDERYHCTMGKLDAEQCRKAAEECRTEAERALSLVDRERWQRMAAEWSERARQAEEKRR